MRMGSSRPYHKGRSFTLIYALRALASMLFLCLQALGQEAGASGGQKAGTSGRSPRPPPPGPAPSHGPVPAPLPPKNSPAPVPSPSPAPVPNLSPAPTPRRPPPPAPAAKRPPPPPPPNPPSHSSNGKTLGIILVSVAGVLQAAVVAFLFVKRRQMLKIVRTYDQNGPSENWNDVSSS